MSYHNSPPNTAGITDTVVKIIRGRYAGHFGYKTTYVSSSMLPENTEYIRLTSGELLILPVDAYRAPVEGEFGYVSR